MGRSVAVLSASASLAAAALCLAIGPAVAQTGAPGPLPLLGAPQRPATAPPLVLRPQPAVAAIVPMRPALPFPAPAADPKAPPAAPAVATPPDLKTKSRKPKPAALPMPLAPAPVLRARDETVECRDPEALGTARVVEVDTSQGLFVGLQYRTKLGLRPREVVLTFDDGPAPNTERALAALDRECAKATFFVVGRMAQAYPQMLRKTAEAGHTIGYHTMNHPFLFRRWPIEKSQEDMIRGWRTVDEILYGRSGDKPAVPFFRYPGLLDTPALNEWLVAIGVGAFSADATGNDWVRNYDADGVLQNSLKELEHNNGGVLLLHDTKDTTVTMLPQLLRELKARGFRLVHLVPTGPRLPLRPLLPGAEPKPLLVAAAPPIAERIIEGYDLAAETAFRHRAIMPATPARFAPRAAPAGVVAEPATIVAGLRTPDGPGSPQPAVAPASLKAARLPLLPVQTPGQAADPNENGVIRRGTLGSFLETVGLK